MFSTKGLKGSLSCLLVGLLCQGVTTEALALQEVEDTNIYVPAPKSSINYKARSTTYSDQGNNFVKAPVWHDESSDLGLPPLYANDKEEGCIDRNSAIQQRLADYDKQFEAQDQEKRDQKPLGDLLAAEEIYLELERSANALYLRNERDITTFRRGLDRVQQMTEGDIGFVVFDDRGPVVIYNNSDFPMLGFTNFHLAYGVATRMQRLNDTLQHSLTFNINNLKPDVFSPLAEFLMQSVGYRVTQSSGLDQPIMTGANNALQTSTPTTMTTPGYHGTVEERSDILAQIAQAIRQGTLRDDNIYDLEAKEVTEQERREAVIRKSEKENALTIEQYKARGRKNSLDLATLLYFSLAFSDVNASDMLIEYIGNLKSLDLFIHRLGMIRSQYKVPDSLAYIRPDSSYMNRGPLFDTARSYVRYLQDTDISPEVRHCIDDIMYFNRTADSTVQKGIKKSIEQDNVDDRYNLKIYSREGVGGINSQGQRVVVSDLSYITYKGHRYLMVIAVKDIPGRDIQSKIQGENIIAFIANALFNYIRVDEKNANVSHLHNTYY